HVATAAAGGSVGGEDRRARRTGVAGAFDEGGDGGLEGAAGGVARGGAGSRDRRRRAGHCGGAAVHRAVACGGAACAGGDRGADAGESWRGREAGGAAVWGGGNAVGGNFSGPCAGRVEGIRRGRARGG